MKCRDIGNLLHDYVEGLLDSPVQQQLDRHLADCPGCTAFIRTYKQTIHLAKELPCEEIPPELQKRLRSFIKQKLQKPSLWARLRARLTDSS